MMRIAVVGTGQLARMLALEGWAMGFQFSFLATHDESSVCVDGLGSVVRYQTGTSAAEVYLQLGSPDVITVEKEDVDIDLLKALQQFCPVYPDPSIIHVCQHRGRERDFLNKIGVPCAVYQKVSTVDELSAAIDLIGLPAILKSCVAGYDGLNQWHFETRVDVIKFINTTDLTFQCILERKVSFTREFSIILVRDINGNHLRYPLTQNRHSKGVLLTSIAPVPDFDTRLHSQVDDIIKRFSLAWNYVGILAIECFETDSGVLVNELAPRVHNSGHWTQLGANTSQFQNHLRAITGMALGATDVRGHAGMINLLGCTASSAVLCQSNSQVHLYNKNPRPGRKLGHVNLVHYDDRQLTEQMNQILGDVYGDKNDSKHPEIPMQILDKVILSDLKPV